MKRNEKKRNCILIITLLIIIAITGIYWGNHHIAVTTYEVKSEKLSESLNDYTIVQISDLHNAKFGKNQKILLNKIKEIAPDLIVITGDLVDSSHADIEVAMDFIEGAVKEAPVYYVKGNHESFLLNYDELKERLLSAGVTVLEDELTEWKVKDTVIDIVGVYNPVLDSTMQQIKMKEEHFTLLLSHQPEQFPLLANYPVDLVLSGHTHGGQFIIPGVGGFVAPDQGFFPKYDSGIFEENETKMIVSRGLGNSIIPLRINNSPEIVVVKLACE